MRTLELACQAAGVDPAELERFLGNAQETLQILIDQPGQFVGNLGAAVERGFEQSGAAFPDHLQRAFLDFLAESGLRIHIPSEMSWGAVFGVALEVLGLDGASLRGRLEERIGEANVERLDAAWQVIEAGIADGWSSSGTGSRCRRRSRAPSTSSTLGGPGASRRGTTWSASARWTT